MRTNGDEQQLFQSYQNGDHAAREELVIRYLPLARKLARQYEPGGETFDDLFQVASLGLVKAVERYDPERNTAFSSFAVPTILGELKRYFRNSGWAAHVPRGTQELVLKMNEAVARLTKELARSPTLREVAEDLGVEVEDVLNAREAAQAHVASSLDAPRGSDGEDDDQTWLSTLGTVERRFEMIEDGLTIAPVMRALSERERTILRLRFTDDLTQSEIADRLGISQMHVSRLLRRALSRIRVVVESTERIAA